MRSFYVGLKEPTWKCVEEDGLREICRRYGWSETDAYHAESIGKAFDIGPGRGRPKKSKKDKNKASI